MGPRNVLLVVTVLLCALFLSTSAQQPPFIDPSPVIQGEVGQNITFACRSTRNNEGVTNSLQFYSNGAFLPFETSQQAVGRLWRTDDGSFSNFIFGELVPEDRGTILRCTSAQQSTGNLTIDVISEPMVTRNPLGNDVEEVREGNSFQVMVDVNANPPPTLYSWTRDGRSVNTGDGIIVSNTSIVFNTVLRRHAGSYVLTVTNIAGTGMISFILNVTYPPEIVGPLSETFNCSESSDEMIECASYAQRNGVFLCAIDGNPSPMLSRTANQVTNTNNVDFETGSNITITNVVSENAGDYICNATLGNEFDVRMFRFYVGGPPQPISRVLANVSADNRYLFVDLTYDNTPARNPVPAKYFFVEAFLSSTEILVFNTTLKVSSSNFYNVSLDPLRASVNISVFLSVAVGNVQGNSSDVDSLPFTIISFNSAKVLSASCILSLVIFAVVMLLF